jgi:dehydrogenase/reductase SDR family member 12
MRLEETRFVRTPVEESFDFVADFTNIENWDPGVTRSRRVDDGPLRVGSSFEVEVKMPTGTMPMTYTITEFDRPSRVVLEGVGKKLSAIDDIRFSEEDGRTRVDYTADLQFKGFMAAVAPLVPGRIRKVGEEAMDGMARALGQ